jgi:uncharacterized protein YndB with AHSA1/START domain
VTVPITIESDVASLTLSVTGDYPVPVERLWRAWADPRQLERFWGPPQWPATFTRHDLVEGGRSEYHMTGPNGETSRGYWRFVEVDAHRGFEVFDGFAAEDGTPNTDFPETRMQMRFTSTPTGSRFQCVSTFASVEALEKLLAMGMREGLEAAFGQLDAVLADLRDLSAGFATSLVREGDTVAIVTRDVRGPLALVWRAHHDASLMRRWLLGPPGWTMPVCDVAAEVGATYRYEWENAEQGARFGFTGELLESEPPRRAVTTERMLGTDGPSTHNELVLTPRPGGNTRLTLRITYPSAELREQILATGMVDGMEASYFRLEDVVAGLA